MFSDLSLRIRNLTDDIAGSLPHLGEKLRARARMQLLQKSRSGNESYDDYFSRSAKEYARLNISSLHVIRSENQLTFSFFESGRNNVAFDAVFFTRYLSFAGKGAYGQKAGITPVQIDTPVLVSTDSKFDPELAAAMHLPPGATSPLDVHVPSNSRGSSDLSTFDVVHMLKSSVNEGGVTPPDILAAAALKLSPAIRMIPFSDLEDVIQRKAELELQYPRIEIVLTAGPAVVFYLAHRISLDLNRPIQGA